jgi:hypothetical protein
MTLFQPVDMMGPAHRGGQFQQMAQMAAQNVLRRQKLRALIQQSAAGARGGTAQPFRGSTHMRPLGGNRGGLFRPPGQDVSTAHAPGAPPPFSYPDPGPMDLPSLPDPTDPSQSPQSIQAPNQFDPTQTPPPLTAPSGFSPAPQTAPSGFGGGTPPPQTAPSGFTGGGDASGGGGLIPLGNGMYYDPVTDTVHGGGGR